MSRVRLSESRLSWLLEKADLDPVYFCQELKLCKYDDNSAGSVSSVQVSPASAAASTTFKP